MFIDERELKVKAGDGGDGLVAWRREARVPRGGPAGGDGGNGGDVVLVADPQLTTFGDMEDVRIARGGEGRPGGTSRRDGARGAPREIAVPVGTTVFDADTGEVLADFDEPGLRLVAGRGGKGGRGNAAFATATEQRPAHAEKGEPGEARRIRLELRLLADVGLVGLPNAGKSTLLSRLSSARPRIADYPFTTLEPHLGIAHVEGFRRLVLADLPGLIEGAHTGHGLGDRFLRHVERTRILLHLVDLAPMDGGDPVEAYRTVRGEIEAYGRGLAERPHLVAGSKVDALEPGLREESLSRLAAEADSRVYPISAVTGEGLAPLLRALVEAVDAAPPPADVTGPTHGARDRSTGA